MKLTTRGHYSVKALLDLALQPALQPVSVNAIAARQSLPAPLVSKKAARLSLRRSGIGGVGTGRAQGGYRLARSPREIFFGANFSKPVGGGS